MTRPWRDKPSLVDNIALGERFRDSFVRGLGWLVRNGKLKLTDEWRQLDDPKVLRRWLKSLRETAWNVFIEAPPHGKSDPQHVVKYLTRYMTGGPISDQRIESDEQGMVTFLARSNSKKPGQKLKPRPIKVSGTEFVRRWSLHVLPKGFTRSRSYGGFHGSRRQAYLETCRQLLPAQPVAEQPVTEAPVTVPSGELLQPASGPICPRCQIEMKCIAIFSRPSWRDILGQNPERSRKPSDRMVASRHQRVPGRNSSASHLPRPES